MLRIRQPIGTVCGERPGPDMSDPIGERVDVAVAAVGLLDLAGEPIGRDATLAQQKSIST